MSKTWDELVEHDADGLVVQCWGEWQSMGGSDHWFQCVECGQMAIVIRGGRKSLPPSHDHFSCPHDDIANTYCRDCGKRVDHVTS